jgi:hypothetical protein
VVEKDEISSYHSGAEQQPRRAMIEKYKETKVRTYVWLFYNAILHVMWKQK